MRRQIAKMNLLIFLSTPSARRATLAAQKLILTLMYFYPRPPRGGRPLEDDDDL